MFLKKIKLHQKTTTKRTYYKGSDNEKNALNEYNFSLRTVIDLKSEFWIFQCSAFELQTSV